ncbi:hypothetical protein E5676_scaffold758G00090 [Cucumis melo var. makuwa]|uniref:Uncharacterized protein n=1 Tax=Cucumis melo var. makuwa TaxID=1194695 RepID=A0A5D3BYJ8_CUCMM|nr:hypothetical protein E5676_scaffold758G00090 [Cucumis melo var. makuwa]
MKMIFETDASEKGYGGIPKQDINEKESLIHFHSGGDLINKDFIVRTDSKANVSNLRSTSPAGRPPLPLPPNQPNPDTPQIASFSSPSSFKGKRPISQASALTLMCADNYAIDLSFQIVSRRRQGSSQRNLTIGSTPDPSTTLLSPTSAITSIRPLSKLEFYARTIKLAMFMPRPLVTSYQTKTILEDIVIKPEFDGPSVQ